MRNVSGLNRAHFSQPIGTILDLTQHHSFSMLVNQEVNKFCDEDCGAIASHSSTVASVIIKECLLLCHTFAVQAIQNWSVPIFFCRVIYTLYLLLRFVAATAPALQFCLLVGQVQKRLCPPRRRPPIHLEACLD